MQMFSPKWMELDPFSAAFKAAHHALSLSEVPVGAVVTYANRIISIGYNQTISLCDPTAHAELLAIREASRLMQNERLTDCDLYVTLEPCAMCAGAIAHARLRRLYFSIPDPKSGGVLHGAKVFDHSTCHHKPEIYDGFRARESRELLQKFFKSLR